MRNILVMPIALAAAVLAAGLGVFGIALVKAIIPIFAITEGTWFQIYVQDPLLYTLVPLYCAWLTFRLVFSRLDRKPVPPAN